MWTISAKRCVALYRKCGYYHTKGNLLQNLTLPMRYDKESLDYSLDISSFLDDSADGILSIQADIEQMELSWLSYGQSCILFELRGGFPDNIGTLFFKCSTVGGRSFEVTLTQKILPGRFSYSDPPQSVPQNLVQFFNTQPLNSSDEALFFFG